MEDFECPFCLRTVEHPMDVMYLDIYKAEQPTHFASHMRECNGIDYILDGLAQKLFHKIKNHYEFSERQNEEELE